MKRIIPALSLLLCLCLAGVPVVEVHAATDPEGSVSFSRLEGRLRNNNLSILTLQQSIDSLEDIDYKELEQDLRDALIGIADAQWMLSMVGEHATSNAMQTQYDALREQFDDIRKGDLQKDNADLIRQLQNGQDQLVLAGEATYIGLASMEIQASSLHRQLDAMDRTVEEMELRYELGQISQLQLQQTKAGRASLASGLETLKMNISAYKMQLELMLGVDLTGELSLGELPSVTQKLLDAMDLEADLEQAKERSYELFDAAKTLKDARTDYNDGLKANNFDPKKDGYRRAERSWQAAQYTYENTLRNYELKFRTLYAQVHDYYQVWQNAQVSLESQQASYAAQELKYEQGVISQNALLSARDELSAAEESVKSAANNLFSSYNTYRWAKEHGILN